ncbi:eukaryotic translation initiation factor 4 gamma 3-like isoform X5 [Erpetoichthys calabaricus]|uniref:eukaryotic translation initiation factor 4 gamma 3-like isoform X5 n=1 Tax=Erpetoichthys calabaricus TaxID=27687 RepID=UPI00109F8BAC|nr:eukaryotic translation initiation factor 4 gamma 3-like isoform X5 [Erpetoichthys calabaricus]
MSLPPKAVPKTAAAAGSGPGTGPSPPSQLRALPTPVPVPGAPTVPPPAAPPPQIPRVQPTLDDRIFPPQAAVTAVYSPVPRQLGTAPAYPAHEITKGHPNLAATPPGHTSSPGLSQVSVSAAHLYRCLKSWESVGGSPYTPAQNAATGPLVYAAPPQTMNAQPQSRPFATGPRPTHHQGGFRPIQFFPRPQMQTARAPIPSNSPSIRPGSQTPAAAVYPPNQPIMMTMTAMPFPTPQGPQYYIPQYRHSSPYVAPPQQYSVQPPGPSTFYTGPGPGEFPTAYGAPYYPGQTVYSSPPILVPTPQQPPPAKREKKTIRIRDPNQGGKDITEEIMLGAVGGAGSRNPTPPVGRPPSTPTPPQQLSSQVPEHGHVMYNMENTPLIPTAVELKQEEKPKQEPLVFKSSSPGLRPDVGNEKRDHIGQVQDLPLPEKPVLPAAVTIAAPSLAATTNIPVSMPPVAAVSIASSSKPVFISDRSELAVLQEEVTAAALAFPQSDIPEVERPSSGPPRNLSPSPANVIPSLNVGPVIMKEMNGVSEKESASVEVELESQDLPLMRPSQLLTANAEADSVLSKDTEVDSPSTVLAAETSTGTCTVATSPPSILHTTSPVSADHIECPSLPITLEAQELPRKGGSDIDVQIEEEIDSLEINSRKSPVQAQTAPPAPKTWKKPKEVQIGERDLEVEKEVSTTNCQHENKEDVTEERVLDLEPEGPCPVQTEIEMKLPVVEENGEQEAEPVGNGAEHNCENESSDLIIPTESKENLEAPQYIFQEGVSFPSDTNGKKQYDREFLLGFQFMPACMQKPEGLPPISDVVLDKINQHKLPMRTLDARVISRGPDFTPAFADFSRQISGGRGAPMISVGQRRSQPGQRREPRKIITNVSVNDDVQLKKAENAWKPVLKREGHVEDPEGIKTQELFRKVRSILNKLTPQMFNQLMKQVADLTIDTEERLKGVIDLVFEKAIDEPSFSVAYANMCRCLATLKVQMTDKPNSTVNFRKLLLNRCQKEFEKDKVDDDVFERKQKELESAASQSERDRLQEELEEAKDKARRRSIGNIKFIGELFKLKMLTEAIMHDCVVKLLKNHDEESLECLCRLLTTIGKDLDFEKAKPRMDQYFTQMEKIVKERKTSSRIRFMLQDVIDLRQNNWVSRRADQGPKTIEQIHKEAKIEEQEEQRKVHQQLLSKDKRRPVVQREETWNTVPMSKSSRTIDPSKIPKITKPTIDDKIQLGPRAQLSWGKGSSGGAKASESDSTRSGTSSLNRFSPLQSATQPVSSIAAPATDFDPRRTLNSGRSSTARERNDKPVSAPTARSGTFTRGNSSKELLDNLTQEEQRREALETVKQLTTMAEEKGGVEADQTRARETGKLEAPVITTTEKPALSEEEMERKSKAIIDEFLHINDYKEAVQCVEELGVPSMMHVFVRMGLESTLERSQITRDHMGQLLFQLVRSGGLSKEEFFKGFVDTLEVADDMAIDIPHIWLYLAELITPIVREGGISMRELFTEFSKPLLPLGRAGVLFSEILHLLCKQMSHRKVGAMWRDSGLNWKDFLQEDEDVQNFISKQKLEYTISDCSSPTEALSKKELSPEELMQQLEKLLLEDMATDEQIFDWVEANLEESQMSSPPFLRALMTAVCKAAVKDESNSCRVDTATIQRRLPVLLKYLNSDTEKQLQALYALQALIVKLDQPPNLLRMFFDCLYDEDVISEDAFYKWESSKDPAELRGKGVALKSVTAFFTWLREAEEESEDN